jgi:hypothetical protein
MLHSIISRPLGAPQERERRPLPGMLLFQDGSTHRWMGSLGRDLDLSHPRRCHRSDLPLLVEEEGTMSSFLALAETIARHGLFGALYTDRGSHSRWPVRRRVDRSRGRC